MGLIDALQNVYFSAEVM